MHGTRSGAQGWVVAGMALFWLAGMALQLQQAEVRPGAPWVAAGLLAAFALALAWWWRQQPATSPVLVFAALLLLGWLQADVRAAWRLADRLPAALEGQDLVLWGRVSGLPQPDAQGVRFQVAVLGSCDADGACREDTQLPGTVSLSWSVSTRDDAVIAPVPPAVQAGDVWRWPVRLKRPHGSLNPVGFDAELWMFEQGIGASGGVRTGAPTDPVLLARARWWHPGDQLDAWRQRLRDRLLTQAGPPAMAGLLAALAVGDQSAIDAPHWDIYRQTGIAHLVSISGIHITLFAWLAAGAVGWAWRRSAGLCHRWPAVWAGRWAGVLAATGYSLLAGWGVPAQRTVGMLLLVAVFRQGGVHWPPTLVLLVTAAVVAGLDPWALLQAGFWLSFAAVALLMLSGHDGARKELAPEGLWPRTRQALRAGLHAQWVATLGLAPLGILIFQQVSLVGLLANLVAVPLVSFVVMPLSLAGLVWSPCWQLAAWFVGPLNAWLHWLTTWPWVVAVVPVAPAWAQAAAVLGSGLMLMRLPWRWRLLVVPLLLPLIHPAVPTPREGAFELIAADVGQGSAVLVRTRHHALLHDTGPLQGADSDAGQRILLPLLQGLGVGALDELTLSHRDTDHVGGAASVLNQMRTHRLRTTLMASHALRQRGLPHEDCAAGQHWQWDGVAFEVLHPAPGADRADRHPNALSCVLRITASNGFSALLTGDIEAPQEHALVVQYGTALHSDVLLVPHHGSRTSSTPEFLDAVSPKWAVLQLGYKNRFGHPHPAVMTRLEASRFTVVRTDECGGWVWRETGASCTRDVRRRYWHWQPLQGFLGAGAEVAAVDRQETR